MTIYARSSNWNGALITSATITAEPDSLIDMPVYYGDGGVATQITNITPSRWRNLTIDLSLRASDERTAKYFMDMVRGSLPPNNTMGLHLVENEFICAWCGSPNPITNRHCGKCGAPRGFIINGQK